MPVGRAQRQAERRAFPIDDQVPLGACLATVRRIGSGLRAPLGRARRRCRARPGASPGGRRHAAAPAVPDAAPPRPRRHATPPAAASRSCRCSPSPQARPAIGCRCATRRGCPPAPHGPAPGRGRPLGQAVRAATAARSPPKDRQQREGLPSTPNAQNQVISTVLNRPSPRVRRECALRRENSGPLRPRHSQAPFANPGATCASRRHPTNWRASL